MKRVSRTTTRRVRRHIQLALAGAALGTVCMAMPSYAIPADVHVSNTNASGAGSLSQAITTGGHVVFDAPLTNGTTFGSALPSITNDVIIDSNSDLNNFTVSQGLTTEGAAAYLYLNGNGTLGAYSITSDLTAKNNSEINIDNFYTVNGATIKVTNGGYVDVYDNSEISLSGDATVDGDSSELDVEYDSSLGAVNLNVTNGGKVQVENSGIDLDGDATVNGDSSSLYLDDSYLDADNLNVTNGGKVQVEDSDITLNGDATVDGDSTLFVEDSYLDADTLNITNGGKVQVEDSKIGLNGDATVDGVSSYLYVNDDYSELEAANLNVTNGGHVDVDNEATIEADDEVNVDGNSQLIVEGGSTLRADSLNVTNGGSVRFYGYSSLHLNDTGTATADGVGSDGNPSEIRLLYGSDVSGNLVASNGGYLELGGTEVTGDVTVNANSMLRSYDQNGNVHLNSDGGTTAFNANSIFAPDILSNAVSVDSLNASNTAQIQPYLKGPFSGSVPVGAAYGRSVIDYDSITGQFSNDVISPFDLGVEYADSSGNNPTMNPAVNPGQVQLYFKSNEVDFNKLPGSENAKSLGSFLNRAINQSQSDPNSFTLGNLPGDLEDFAYSAVRAAAYDGDLSQFDEDLPTNLSSHNTQAYWNQKSFVDSIRANLNNDRNSEGGKSTFALNQVSNANGTSAQLASLRQATSTNFNHLNYAGNNGSNPSGVWASYNGNHQHTDGDRSIGSSDWSSSTDGFNLGYTSGGSNFSWGAAVGHQKSTFKFNDLYNFSPHGELFGEQSGWNAGLYAAWKGKSGYLNGVLGYGNFDNDSKGYLGNSTFKTKATSASLEIGKHVRDSKSSSLTPYASVLWTRIKQSDATVSHSLPGLILKSGTNNVFATQLGVRYNHRMYDKDGALKGGWQAGLAWLHQGGDTGFPVNLGSSLAPGAGTFAVKSTPLAGNSAVVQLGAYGRIHHNLIGFAGYQGTFGSSQKVNAVNAGIGYQF